MSHSNSTTYGYRVEARYNFSSPKAFGQHVLDKEWREISFNEGPIGVPNRGFCSDELKRCGLYDYAQAQALRWWFHAEFGFDGICLETRIKKFKVVSTLKWDEESTHDQVGGDDRSNIMPDWGQPQPSSGSQS